MKATTIVICVIVIGVMIYAATAKNITITSTTGGGQTDTHNGVLSFLDGWLNNVTVFGVSGGG
jgi:hypothetical protein